MKRIFIILSLTILSTVVCFAQAESPAEQSAAQNTEQTSAEALPSSNNPDELRQIANTADNA